MAEQLRIAQDGIHRRANFVRHIGQKFCLGTVGGSGGLGSSAKFYLVLSQLLGALFHPPHEPPVRQIFVR